jgi:hypothetical protein
LLLPLLDEIFFALRKRMRRRAHIVRQTDFDIIIYALADATGLVVINDARHGGREREGRNGGMERRGKEDVRAERDIS